MNLLFSWAEVPTTSWIAAGAVALVAIILIIIILVWAHKKSPKKNSAAKSKPADAKPAETSAAAKEETAVKEETAATVSAPVTTAATAASAPATSAKTAASGEKVYHISKRKTDGKWQIKLEGGAKAIRLFDTQAEAIAYGKTLAGNQDARFVLHKTDGSFRKLTY